MGACVQAVAEGGVVVANLFNNTPNGYTRARFASFACHVRSSSTPLPLIPMLTLCFSCVW